ncbi:MAG: methyltransferase domain-containing protein [Burkholderiales bacterium]|nr:methyltransferase domain-containing protein [Burkholderiales bacterium]
MKRRAFLAALAAAGCSTPGLRLDAPYVSTPYEVVRAMLALARVGPADVVYDLGCGDGRIVVTAAREFGARGVGVDLDPRRIEEARAAARRAGVEHRVRFAVQDLFLTDLAEATVVALYLFPELNVRLAPKLRAELQPGARVVSHQYGIGDWKPAASVRVESGGTEHWVHLWVIPPR